MKPKKLKKRIQQLEKRLREGSEKLASLRRKLQQAETAKALKAARKSAARVTASAGKKSLESTTGAKKPKRKLNLSPERRAQLAAAMKARWAAKRAAEGNSTTSGGPKFSNPANAAAGKQSRRRLSIVAAISIGSAATQNCRVVFVRPHRATPFHLIFWSENERRAQIHCCFSSQSFWKTGSERNGSQIGSSLKSADVMGGGL